MTVMTDVVEPLTYSAGEVCTQAGVTYRQLDYWLRRELFDLDPEHDIRTPGSGMPRRFSLLEAQRVVMLARCIKAGLNYETAAKVVRRKEAEPLGAVVLGEDLYLTVDWPDA